MRIPTMAATVERRLLVNYRVAPDIIASMLPAPFRPQLAGGAAVAGICLIRLGDLRPAGLPAAVGIRTENAAHRIAVEWDAAGGGPARTGVFIPSRHTASRPTAWFGGRLFPGMHRYARFSVHETGRDLRVAFIADNGSDNVDVALSVADRWPGSALFADLAEASEFFRVGAAGYSVTRDPHRLDGLELRTTSWQVEAGTVSRAASSFFDDPRVFPPGTAQLDTALIMRDVPVTWHGLPPMHTGNTTRSAATTT